MVDANFSLIPEPSSAEWQRDFKEFKEFTALLVQFYTYLQRERACLNEKARSNTRHDC